MASHAWANLIWSLHSIAALLMSVCRRRSAKRYLRCLAFSTFACRSMVCLGVRPRAAFALRLGSSFASAHFCSSDLKIHLMIRLSLDQSRVSFVEVSA